MQFLIIRKCQQQLKIKLNQDHNFVCISKFHCSLTPFTMQLHAPLKPWTNIGESFHVHFRINLDLISISLVTLYKWFQSASINSISFDSVNSVKLRLHYWINCVSGHNSHSIFQSVASISSYSVWNISRVNNFSLQHL